jgi:hypothetical protein
MHGLLARIMAAVVALCAMASLAKAQGAVVQSGPVTPFHSSAWSSNGVVGDGGSPQTPFLSSLGLFNGSNCPFGISSQTGPGVSTSPYALFTICQTPTTSTLVFAGVNGQANPSVFFNIGGVNYPFPGGYGNVNGPVTSVSGNVVCFNNAFGTLLTGCGPASMSGPLTITPGTSVGLNIVFPGQADFNFSDPTNPGVCTPAAPQPESEITQSFFNSAQAARYAFVLNTILTDCTSGTESSTAKLAVIINGARPVATYTIVAGGSGFVNGEIVSLTPANGAQSMTANPSAVVTAQSGGAVTSASVIMNNGLFPSNALPTQFNETTSTGSGTGLQLAPIYSVAIPEPVVSMQSAVVQALDQITFASNPTNGQTVIIGAATYTFQTSLTNVAGNVLIGANPGASRANLICAINATSGGGCTPGTNYATVTTANTQVSAQVCPATGCQSPGVEIDALYTVFPGWGGTGAVAVGGTAGSWLAPSLVKGQTAVVGTANAAAIGVNGVPFVDPGQNATFNNLTTNGTIINSIRTVIAAGAVTVLRADYTVVVNKTSGAATTVNLDAIPATGEIKCIKDGKGDAGANNITLTPAAGLIDGASTYVISTNYGAACVQYGGTAWNVISH